MRPSHLVLGLTMLLVGASAFAQDRMALIEQGKRLFVDQVARLPHRGQNGNTDRSRPLPGRLPISPFVFLGVVMRPRDGKTHRTHAEARAH